MRNIKSVMVALYLGIATAGLSILGVASSAHAMPFHLLLETDADAAAGSEVFLVSYNSLADIQAANLAFSSSTQIDVGANFSIGGLAAELPIVGVPEPGTLALFGLGLAGLGLARRREAS